VAHCLDHPFIPKAEKAVEVILDELQSSIERGRGLRFGVSGHLMVKPKKLGVARNPKTGQVVPIPPGRTVRIKPSKALGTRSRREKTHYE
jgi:DNA-binding protein HU-beta